MSAASASSANCVFFRTIITDNTHQGPILPVTHPEVAGKDYAYSDYCIQHIKDKPSLGICFSGGGFRAATCAAGYARGLHLTTLDSGKSVLSQVQYVSSTSGGSWFNAAFSYKGPNHELTPLDKFLGKYIEAENLKLDKIQQDPPADSFEHAIAALNALDALIQQQFTYFLPITAEGIQDIAAFAHTAKAQVKALIEEHWYGRNVKDDAPEQDQQEKVPGWVRPWTLAVTKSFLEPFHLGVFEDTTVSAAYTEGGIDTKRAAKNAEKVLLACTDHDRPFPIMTGTCFCKEGTDGYSLYPLEFSPLYFGTPAPFPDCKPAFGGGYMEPWGLHAEPGKLTCTPDDCVVTVPLTRNDKDVTLHTVPLAQATAISSSFLAAATYNLKSLTGMPSAVAAKLAEFAQDFTSTEKLVNWGVIPSKIADVPDHGLMGFADGGTLDNLAVMPLLRRGVKCLVVFMGGATPPDDTWERFAEEKSDVAALFGAAKGWDTPGLQPSLANDLCQVFGKDTLEGEKLFRELFEALHDKLRAGEPGFYRTSYKIYENTFFHIPASKEPVEVLWIHNQQWADWEQKLPGGPGETKEQLIADRKGKDGNHPGVHHKTVMKRELAEGEIGDGLGGGLLKQDDLFRFPYFTTLSLDYSNTAVNMLGQLCTAVVMHEKVQEHIKELVAIASKAFGSMMESSQRAAAQAGTELKKPPSMKEPPTVQERSSVIDSGDAPLNEDVELSNDDNELLQKLAAAGNEIITVQVDDNNCANLEGVLESLGYALLRITEEGHVYATKALLQSLHVWPFSSSSSSGTPAASPAATALGRPGTSPGAQAGQPSSSVGADPTLSTAQQNATPVASSACHVCTLVLCGEVPATLQSSVSEAAGSRRSPGMEFFPVAGKGDKIVLKSQDSSSGTDKRVTAILHVCVKPPVMSGDCELLCVTIQRLAGCIERKRGVQPANNCQETVVGVQHLHVSVAATHGDKPVTLVANLPTGVLQEALGCPPQRGGGIPLQGEVDAQVAFTPNRWGIGQPSITVGGKISNHKPTSETHSSYPLIELLECNSHLLSDSLDPVSFRVRRHGDNTKMYQNFDLNSVAIPTKEQVVFRGLLDAAVEGLPDQQITIMLGAELQWQVAKPKPTQRLASIKAIVIPGEPEAAAFTASATLAVETPDKAATPTGAC